MTNKTDTNTTEKVTTKKSKMTHLAFSYNKALISHLYLKKPYFFNAVCQTIFQG